MQIQTKTKDISEKKNHFVLTIIVKFVKRSLKAYEHESVL